MVTGAAAGRQSLRSVWLLGEEPPARPTQRRARQLRSAVNLQCGAVRARGPKRSSVDPPAQFVLVARSEGSLDPPAQASCAQNRGLNSNLNFVRIRDCPTGSSGRSCGERNLPPKAGPRSDAQRDHQNPGGYGCGLGPKAGHLRATFELSLPARFRRVSSGKVSPKAKPFRRAHERQYHLPAC